VWWGEPLEYGDVDRKPVQSRVQDPGVATTILYVRNVDAMLAKLQKAGTPIVTSPAAPVQVAFGATTGRAVVVRDPGRLSDRARAAGVLSRRRAALGRHRRRCAHDDQQHRPDDARLPRHHGLPAEDRLLQRERGLQQADRA
jgi:hypothetical protein